jgi:hypothetical protein
MVAIVSQMRQSRTDVSVRRAVTSPVGPEMPAVGTLGQYAADVIPAMLRRHAEAPLPRPLSRRAWILVAVLAVLFLLAFGAVFRAYDAEGGLKVNILGAEAAAGKGIRITLSPLALDAETNELTVRLRFDPENMIGLTDKEDRLTQALRVTVSAADGSHEFRYQVGDQLSAQSATLGISGMLSSYPFDKYNTAIWFAADMLRVGPNGRTVHDTAVATKVLVTGSIMNWNTVVDQEGSWSTNSTILMDFDRVFSTRTFALIMLGLMAILAIVAVVIAELAITNRRRAEMGMLSWLAGLLFAFPALRRTMPDAPPIGVTIDIAVFLWTLLAALISAVLMALSWGIQTKETILAQITPASDGPHRIDSDPAPADDLTNS